MQIVEFSLYVTACIYMYIVLEEVIVYYCTIDRSIAPCEAVQVSQTEAAATQEINSSHSLHMYEHMHVYTNHVAWCYTCIPIQIMWQGA